MDDGSVVLALLGSGSWLKAAVKEVVVIGADCVLTMDEEEGVKADADPATRATRQREENFMVNCFPSRRRRALC